MDVKDSVKRLLYFNVTFCKVLKFYLSGTKIFLNIMYNLRSSEEDRTLLKCKKSMLCYYSLKRIGYSIQ